MTNFNDDQAFSRRIFLQQGVTLASMTATIPLFLQNSAFGLMRPLGSLTTSQAGVPEDRVLVVIQLGGGNDGLNTVIPFGDPAYYRARPGLGVREPGPPGTRETNGNPGSGRNNNDSALTIAGGDGIGLNPAMSAFKDLIEEGVASIVQGVGYPNPNRSHFASMDIWHTASESGTGNGWLGRYFDNTCNGTPGTPGTPGIPGIPAAPGPGSTGSGPSPNSSIAIGRSAPLALVGQLQKPVSFESAELFRWMGGDLASELDDPYHQITRQGELKPHSKNEQSAQLDFLTRTALDAQVSSERIRTAVGKQPLVRYPGGELSRQMQFIGAMIRDGMPTRVYYASLGGFDTHANQSGVHANLLRQVSDSLKVFHEDLKAQGNNPRVLTIVFSEFGRRVAQNASGGTDHGTAAPMYLMGDMVRPGLLGQHPSLTDLDEGDLKYSVDFRSVYATVLDEWMGGPADKVLQAKFPRAKILKTS